MKRRYNGTYDLEGVGMFVLMFMVVASLIALIGFLVVQDSNHQTECVNAGKVYVDGNCLNADTTVVTD